MVIDAAAARAWVEAFMAAVDEQRDALNELDRRSGDGDFGANLEAAVARIRRRLDGAATVSGVFAAVSGAFLDTGGTSGPLYGMWFRALARSAEGADAVGLEALAAGATEGVRTVQRLGHAEVGDKTMVDAMAPAAQALADAGGLRAGLRAAAREARAGAASTEAIAARRGRASYVGDVARGVLDPGAVTVALFFETAPIPGEPR
jgi:dihydroxyacetone kinase-like protein